MKKKGVKWNKFKNLDKEILKIIYSSKREKTINDIRLDLEKKGLKVSWVTTKNYLESLLNKKPKKIKVTKFGKNRPVLYWSRI